MFAKYIPPIVCALSTLACSDSFLFESSGSGGSGGTGSVTTVGTGGNDACAAFDDQVGEAVTLRVRNNTGMDIFLPTDCGIVKPTVAPAAGPDGTNYNYYRSCLSTCADLRDTGPVACPADACALTALRVPPGGTYDIEWDGTGLRPTDMPAQCFLEPTQDLTCGQIVAAPAASYQVELQAFDSCGVDCMCETNGQCFGEASGLEGFHAPVSFQHPEQGVVEVLFDICAFGCAESSQ